MARQWQRSTPLCPTIGLEPDLLDAIRAHVEVAELDPVEQQALICFETHSQRLKKPSRMERRAGAGHKALTHVMIVTPTRLVWAQRTDEGEAGAHSELLARLDVTDYEKGPAASLMPDHGLEVFGVVGQGGAVGTVFFGFGEGPDADRAPAGLQGRGEGGPRRGVALTAPEATPASPQP